MVVVGEVEKPLLASTMHVVRNSGVITATREEKREGKYKEDSKKLKDRTDFVRLG
jgi:hypothetical protein